ncbi:MAG: ParA family protein [Microthrixaceae bacterium]
MRVISVAGAKGGVGKTAVAVNLAMLSARSGRRTLLWDLDPQAAATHCYRLKAKVKGGAGRMLGGKRDLQAFVRGTDYDNLDLVPVDKTFRVVDTVLSARRWPDRAVRKLLRPVAGDYDVAILDCAPGLGVMAESVFAASDLVIAPIVPAPLAIRSLDQMTEFIDEYREGLPLLAVLSMVDRRKVLHRQMLESVSGDGRFAEAAIPLSSSVERMGLEQVPAVLASPRNLSAKAFNSLWDDVCDRIDIAAGPDPD